MHGGHAVVGRLRLFLSSYAPAFALIAIRWDGWLLRTACAAVALISAVDVLRLPKRARAHQELVWVKVRAIENVGAEVGAYLASYLLPLLTAPDPTGRDLIAYGLFLALSAVIYIQSDLIRVNPVLFIAGYRVLKIATERPQPDFLLAREALAIGDRVGTVRLAGVLVMRGRADA